MTELKARFTHDELVELREYSEIEPWGPMQEELRAGVVAAAVANTIPRERGSKAFKPSDLLPSLRGDDPAPRPKKRRRWTLKDEERLARRFGPLIAGGSP